MTNKQLQTLLATYPDDMPVKLMTTHQTTWGKYPDPLDLDEERVILTSETVYIDGEAPEDQWDTEDGKLELGQGARYLLVNPVIL